MMAKPAEAAAAAPSASSSPENATTRAILPNLQLLVRGGGGGAAPPPPPTEADIVDGLDTRFCGDLTLARRLHSSSSSFSFPSSSSSSSEEEGVGKEEDVTSDDVRSVPELLVAYFAWLAWLLGRAEDHTVSLRRGGLLGPKRALWRNCRLWRVSVEDPFETHDSVKPHDLGQVVTPEGQALMLRAAREAVALLSAPAPRAADGNAGGGADAGGADAATTGDGASDNGADAAPLPTSSRSWGQSPRSTPSTRASDRFDSSAPPVAFRPSIASPNWTTKSTPAPFHMSTARVVQSSEPRK